MDSYRILLGPISDGAAVHEDGSIIPLGAEEAAPLLELGIVELVPADEQVPAKATRSRKAAAD